MGLIVYSLAICTFGEEDDDDVVMMMMLIVL